MHSAPSVSYPVGRSRFSGLLLAALWCGGAAVTVLWWRDAAPAPARLVLAVTVLGLTGLLAWQGWRRAPAGHLRWDGQGWLGPGHRESGAGPGAGSLTVRLDFQRWMLVEFREAGLVRWLWLSRTRDLARWDDLRRAVYSRAKPDARRDAANP